MDPDQRDYHSCGSNFSTPNSLKARIVELQETEKLVDVTKSPSVYDSTTTTVTPSSPHHFTSRELTIALLSAAAGNCMEWYNFSLFGLLADEFGELFFPKSNPTVHLMQAYAVFAVVYLVRPLGGTIFGYIGDRYGRVYTLKLAISVMAATTLIIAFLPTYHDIGITATIIMILIRLIQGLSVGAEYPAAMIYITEVCPPERRATFATLCQISGLGGILSSLFITVLYATLTPTEILDFYWRTPFVFGGVIGLLGIWSRSQLNDDSPTKTNTDCTIVSMSNPVLHALRTCKWRMLSIILHCTLAVSQSYLLGQWLPSYFLVIAGYKFNAFGINIISYLLICCTGLLSAHLIDTFKYMTSSKILIIFGPLQVILNTVLFQYLDDPNDQLMAIAIWLICAASYGLYFGAALGIWFMDILPDSSCKQSAFGIAYNIGTFWGGTASLIATFVESHYGGIGAVGWMLLVFGCIGIGNDIIASRFIRDSNLKTIR